MYCEQCGIEILEKANFCNGCGAKKIPEYNKNQNTKIESKGSTNEISWKFKRLAAVSIVLLSLMSAFYFSINDKYRALGFSSNAEMEDAFSKGYHTKRKLDEMARFNK